MPARFLSAACILHLCQARTQTRSKDMSTATLTSKGRITIPRDVRERLRVQPGDRLEFVMKDDGVILRPATRKVTDIKGFFPKPKRPFSLEEMDRAIRRRAGSNRPQHRCSGALHPAG